MSVQQFCLRWNNHQPNFISVCSSLLHNGTLVDVTLAAEGRQLQAHKIVLSACSSYFQTLFTSNPCQHPIVILKDVQYDDLKTMVDFMYYGEVNVSQEQLPHILKTAEMLKIKGLAEMPTDPANLTKSESKSSNEPTDLVGSGSTGSNGQSSSGVTSGGLGTSASGSMGDSLWEQQHHHGQHSDTQFQSHHHQQQQNSQTQTSQQQQQHHQLRRTPSPLGAGASPATRRKRLRKSSNNGSGDRTNSEEQHNTSLDSGNTHGGISLTQMGQMSFGTGAGTITGMPTHSLHATKLLKESTSTDVESHPQDDSLDDGHAHVHMQIKPEVDMSSVQQSMPLDISAATTPSEHDAPNSQSSHSDAEEYNIRKTYNKYSPEDRRRIVEAAARGENWAGLATSLGVTYKTAWSWANSGRSENQSKGGSKPKMLSQEQIDIIVSWIEENSSITLTAIQTRIRSEFNIGISRSTVGNYLEGRIYTIKAVHTDPITLSSSVNEEKWADFIIALNEELQAGKQIVCIGETNFNLFCRHSRGRSAGADRATTFLPAVRAPNIHLVGAISSLGIVSIDRQRGSFKDEAFRIWLDSVLIRWCELGYSLNDLVIVCDDSVCHSIIENAVADSSHGRTKVMHLSPHFLVSSPIKTIWNKIKMYVKVNITNSLASGPNVIEERLQHLENLVDDAKDTITGADCALAFQNASFCFIDNT